MAVKVSIRKSRGWSSEPLNLIKRRAGFPVPCERWDFCGGGQSRPPLVRKGRELCAAFAERNLVYESESLTLKKCPERSQPARVEIAVTGVLPEVPFWNRPVKEFLDPVLRKRETELE